MFALKGILEEPDTDGLLGGVVIAHPHPEHGGSMAHPGVLDGAGMSRPRDAVLRFNFRGRGQK